MSKNIEPRTAAVMQNIADLDQRMARNRAAWRNRPTETVSSEEIEMSQYDPATMAAHRREVQVLVVGR